MAVEPEHVSAARSKDHTEKPRPLSDSELDRIPVTSRCDAAGLSRAAKAGYASLRSFARGREHAFPAPSTLEQRMGVSADTRKRAVDELLKKEYLEDTALLE